MKHIGINTQSALGGEPKFKDNFGFVAILMGHSLDFISVDNFEGQGSTYKKREQQLINIVQNGERLFQGTKYELYQLLRSATQKADD